MCLHGCAMLRRIITCPLLKDVRKAWAADKAEEADTDDYNNHRWKLNERLVLDRFIYYCLFRADALGFAASWRADLNVRNL